MNITLNNRPDQLDTENPISIEELIILKNFTFKFLVTKINGKLIKKDKRQSSLIHDGDVVEVIHLISGG